MPIQCSQQHITAHYGIWKCERPHAYIGDNDSRLITTLNEVKYNWKSEQNQEIESVYSGRAHTGKTFSLWVILASIEQIP